VAAVASCSVLAPVDAPAYRGLAFPRHRPLLLDDLHTGGTVAVGAELAGQPIGLALAGPSGGDVASLHAVVVAASVRGRGIGGQLLGTLEAAMHARGVRRLVAAHRSDRPNSDLVGRLLARAGYERSGAVVEFVFSVPRVAQAPVLRVSCSQAEVIAHTPERLAALCAVREPSGMDPGALSADDVDPMLATLVAVDGQSAACMLGRREGHDTAYASLLFVRPDLRRRTRLAAFTVRRFLERLTAHGISTLTCEVSLDNAESLAFVDQRLSPFAEHRAVVHIVGKTIGPLESTDAFRGESPQAETR